jgi:hypothetical protein
MDFKWSVNKLTVAEDNLVVKVDATVTATDADGNTASAAYVRDLVRGDSFIPFEQLTEEQVLDWCFTPEIITTVNLTDNTTTTTTRLIKDEGEAQVSGQIARQLAQKASEPALPWAQIPA